MTEKPRRIHFGAHLERRMAGAETQEYEEPPKSRRRSTWDFDRELEQRIREAEAGD